MSKHLTLNDLVPYVFNEVSIYKDARTDDDYEPFVDLYKGYLQKAPEYILSLSVRSIGSTIDRNHRGIIDIRVE